MWTGCAGQRLRWGSGLCAQREDEQAGLRGAAWICVAVRAVAQADGVCWQ
ncbi:hypothetical protein RchiOBHm_Chr7g0193011 [Rosa chinensis]|uniref:Uncharacterized protein n=1 Tax=Rosa chinensis TaxID=74649 RepID=A0A2P6P5N8_ROSCH|nr:hypothetical protein RchiOBHm_Chr7g0193011 [Rosa chinensis]